MPLRHQRKDFYPRPPRGGRRRAIGELASLGVFLSTPSARRATPTSSRKRGSQRYFYPRPPRGGRRTPKPIGRACPYFYPRPPRGGRLGYQEAWAEYRIFLSTPSARRATRSARNNRQRKYGFLSTPSARRATRVRPPASHRAYISIHALREEGDTSW